MASRGINKVILVGNLGQDPEIRYMPNGGAVANITLATSESWRDKQTGEQKEKTEWHRVVLFGKLAEVAGEYLRKGSQVYIEGALQTRKWQDQSGQERYTTEVVVNIGGSMQMLGGRQGQSPVAGNTSENWSKQRQPQVGGHQSNSGQISDNLASSLSANQYNPNHPSQNQNTSMPPMTGHNTPADRHEKQSNEPSVAIDFDDDIPF